MLMTVRRQISLSSFACLLTYRYMIRHLDHYLDYQREYRGGSCAPVKRFCARHLYILCGNRFGNYLVTLYLSIKVHTYLFIKKLFIIKHQTRSFFHILVSAPSATEPFRFQLLASGTECRQSGTRQIVAVATHIQTPFEDFPFLPQVFPSPLRSRQN